MAIHTGPIKNFSNNNLAPRSTNDLLLNKNEILTCFQNPFINIFTSYWTSKKNCLSFKLCPVIYLVWHHERTLETLVFRLSNRIATRHLIERVFHVLVVFCFNLATRVFFFGMVTSKKCSDSISGFFLSSWEGLCLKIMVRFTEGSTD